MRRVSAFFEPPPPPPPLVRSETPEWMGPPRDVAPAVVPVELVVGRSEEAAIYVASVAVYPTGFAFELISVLATRDEPIDPRLMHRMHIRGALPDGTVPDEMLRVGVRFADGSKATNLGGRGPGPPRDGPPDHPILLTRGGGGGDNQWRETIWVWPLPPPGPLAFVVEWPAFGIPLSEAEVDGTAILDAAARATPLFA